MIEVLLDDTDSLNLIRGDQLMGWIRHYAQTIVAVFCIGGTLAFCAYAIVDYESDRCHYRELRGFDEVLGDDGWCRIL